MGDKYWDVEKRLTWPSNVGSVPETPPIVLSIQKLYFNPHKIVVPHGFINSITKPKNKTFVNQNVNILIYDEKRLCSLISYQSSSLSPLS